jgi:hypothetical protein
MSRRLEIAALFNDFDAARCAILELKAMDAHGEPIERMQLSTPIPHPELEQAIGTRPVVLRRFTLAGALTGAVLGFVLAAAMAQAMFTVQAQGGKPIIPLPANFVIMYELTILFGVWFTLAGFLFGAGLPKRLGKLHSPKVGEDQVGLWVEVLEARYDRVKAVFVAHGAVELLEGRP